MLDIKVLGPGCANCFIVEGLVTAAVQILADQKPQLFENTEVTLDHLSDPDDFRSYGVMYTPGLVINEQLVAAGRLPGGPEIMAAIENALVASKTTATP